MPGSVARIFTGAELPAGADTVVMQENCREHDNGIEIDAADSLWREWHATARTGYSPRPIVGRRRGISPARGGYRALLAAAGVTADSGPASRAIKVALLCTGDELIDPGNPLAPGQIYNSNRPLLIGLLEQLGCEVIDLGIIPDTAGATADALQRAARTADCVISTGGVSVGDEDHVRAQLELHGELRLWKLNIKPGKPLAYGRMLSVPFFGLPGNPASAFMHFFLIDADLRVCQKLQGQAYRVATASLKLPAAVTGYWPQAGSLQEYLRARVVAGAAGLQVEIFPNQSSGVLASVAWANALAVIYPHAPVQRGDLVEVILLSDIFSAN